MHRLIGVLLALGAGCQGDGRTVGTKSAPDTVERVDGRAASRFGGFGRFTPLELRLYEKGRIAEVAALRRHLADSAPHDALALDSIGAAAAGVGPDRYLSLAADIDSALVQAEEARDAATTPLAAPPRNPRVRQLDSLRLERLVLVIRMQALP